MHATAADSAVPQASARPLQLSEVGPPAVPACAQVPSPMDVSPFYGGCVRHAPEGMPVPVPIFSCA